MGERQWQMIEYCDLTFCTVLYNTASVQHFFLDILEIKCGLSWRVILTYKRLRQLCVKKCIFGLAINKPYVKVL